MAYVARYVHDNDPNDYYALVSGKGWVRNPGIGLQRRFPNEDNAREMATFWGHPANLRYSKFAVVPLNDALK
jgi:hypothetical protein